MKINISEIKINPQANALSFFGKNEKLLKWAKFHNLPIKKVKQFIDVDITGFSLEDLFNSPKQYDWMDGFSPNSNKNLHVGHLSNLIISKALDNMNVSQAKVFIDNNVDGYTDEFSNKIRGYAHIFDYKVSKYIEPQEIKFKGELIDGIGKYENSKGVFIDNQFVVCKKSNGNTTYFFEDMLMLQELDGDILYVTGKEQKNHFKLLKSYDNRVNHLPIGHVSIDGKKMSSRLGNVVFIDDLFEMVKQEMYDNDIASVGDVAFNVIVASMLEKKPTSDKKINLDIISDLKQSSGLYLSYTQARLLNAGVKTLNSDEYDEYPKKFYDEILEVALYKSKESLNPSFLFKYVIEKAKEANKAYENVRIQGALPNILEYYEKLLWDISLGMEILGMKTIYKV